MITVFYFNEILFQPLHFPSSFSLCFPLWWMPGNKLMENYGKYIFLNIYFYILIGLFLLVLFSFLKQTNRHVDYIANIYKYYTFQNST